MKTCPYCAEEIQDAAIKCRYCQSDLTVPPPTASGATSGDAMTASEPVAAAPAEPDASTSAEPDASPSAEAEVSPSAEPASTEAAPEVAPVPAAAAPSMTPTPTPTPAPAAAPPATAAPAADPSAVDTSNVRYTHSGYRYVLGYGADFFGVWDRQAPTVPIERFARTDEGWRMAWTRFATLEPNHVPVPQGGGAAQPPTSPTTLTTSSVDNDVLQYTHSGQRYLLGYGRTFFGIWDRQAPQTPIEKFARDDAGWAAAWRRYTSIEQHYAEVANESGGGSSPIA